MSARNVVIIGAAGRDFHNFNTFFRDKKEYNVVAFTAAQIPGHRRPQVSRGAGRPAVPEGDPYLR